MPPESGDVLARVWGLLSHLGDADIATAAVGLGCLVVLFGGARLLPRVPWGLVVLVVSIAVSSPWSTSPRRASRRSATSRRACRRWACRGSTPPTSRR